MNEHDKFSGKKVKYNTFVKLMGKIFKEVMVMLTLTIPTAWDTTNADAKL